MKTLDAIDKQLLALLQMDAETPIAELAAKVNLSSTPCWRRVQQLKENGHIRKQVALLDAKKLNVGVPACRCANQSAQPKMVR